MRTFHIGGAASRAAAVSNIQVKTKGNVKLENIKSVRNKEGQLVVVTRSGELIIKDLHGGERERYRIPYGSVLLVDDGDTVDPGQRVAQWDPYTHPIITERAGKLQFSGLVEGLTMNRQTDEMTGLSSFVVTSARERSGNEELRPMIRLQDESGEDLPAITGSSPAHFFLPEGTIVHMADGDLVSIGDVIARIPQETGKTRDITGGLPRVADLFEARKPKDPAILAELTGVVSFGRETKDKERLIITTEDGTTSTILVPKWCHPLL
jgi:DNA-directed RNA polymerase subunit beta'